jgi:hypothetical protein
MLTLEEKFKLAEQGKPIIEKEHKPNIFMRIFKYKISKQNRFDYFMGIWMGCMLMFLAFSAVVSYPRLMPIIGQDYYSDTIPPEEIQIKIAEISPELQQYVYKMSYVDDEEGSYTPFLNVIQIKDYDNFRYVMHHEIGHRVWSLKLSSEQKSEFKDVAKTEEEITEYAKTNIKEDFAETFACYYDYYTTKEGYKYGCRINYKDTNRIKWMESNKGDWE